MVPTCVDSSYLWYDFEERKNCWLSMRILRRNKDSYKSFVARQRLEIKMWSILNICSINSLNKLTGFKTHTYNNNDGTIVRTRYILCVVLVTKEEKNEIDWKICKLFIRYTYNIFFIVCLVKKVFLYVY